MSQFQHVLIGDGYATSWMARFLAGHSNSVLWLTGSGLRTLPTQYSGASMFLENSEDHQPAQFRIFRNKAFRDFSGEQDHLWSGESKLIQSSGIAAELSSFEILEAARLEALALFSDGSAQLLRVECGISSIAQQGDEYKVVLQDGQVFTAEKLTYADRWNMIAQIEGLPRPFIGVRGRESFSILQAVFDHNRSLGIDLKQTFIGTLSKEANESAERHLFGYFNSLGNQSVWTIALSHDEIEDNHLIGKRLRRMKQTLDKMFEGLSQEEGFQFTKTISHERVRFDDHAFLSGEFLSPGVFSPKGLFDIEFVSEEFGWESLQTQLMDWTSRRLSESRSESQSLGSISQNETIDLTHSQIQ